MAGRIQILTRGYAGEYLTTNPDFTYFNNRYAKYTNFSKESFSLKPENIKEVSTGDTVNFRIPIKRGDLLNRISFDFSIPENLDYLNDFYPIVTGSSTYKSTNTEARGPSVVPIDNFGISVIEYVELYIGDQCLDRITSDDILVYIQTRESYSGTHRELIGDDLADTAVTYPTIYFGSNAYDGQFSRTRDRLYDAYFKAGLYLKFPTKYSVDIPFYFHKRPGYGFPLCALEYQELDVRVKLRNAKKVLFPSIEIDIAYLLRISTADDYSIWNFGADDNTNDFTFTDFKLNVDVTYLDTPERMRLKCQTRDVLIEQRQHNTFKMEGGVKNQKYRLDFKNCVKEIYFIAKKVPNILPEQIGTYNRLIFSISKRKFYPLIPSQQENKYHIYNMYMLRTDHFSTIHPSKPVPCIYMKQKVTTLTCDNVPILDEVTGSDQFLISAIPDIHNTRVPNRKNIMYYSFALYPDKLEPSGHLNFSTIKNALVDMTLYTDGSIAAYDAEGNYIEDYWIGSEEGYVAPRNIVKDIIVTAKSYNVLRFENGAAKLLF